MVKFLDGPAEGVVLALHRAPVMLRVVRSATGQWDALDQLDDKPNPGEAIHVYRRQGDASMMHLCARRASGWYAMAEYAHLPEQPADEHVRDTASWRAWCGGAVV